MDWLDEFFGKLGRAQRISEVFSDKSTTSQGEGLGEGVGCFFSIAFVAAGIVIPFAGILSIGRLAWENFGDIASSLNDKGNLQTTLAVVSVVFTVVLFVLSLVLPSKRNLPPPNLLLFFAAGFWLILAENVITNYLVFSHGINIAFAIIGLISLLVHLYLLIKGGFWRLFSVAILCLSLTYIASSLAFKFVITPLESQIIGTWESVERGGAPVPRDKETVYIFREDGTSTIIDKNGTYFFGYKDPVDGIFDTRGENRVQSSYYLQGNSVGEGFDVVSVTEDTLVIQKVSPGKVVLKRQ